MAMAEDRFMGTEGGASLEVDALCEEEPIWQQRTVPTSQQAAKRGSHLPEWIEGMSRASGFSEKVTA